MNSEQREESLFEAALKLSAHERAGYLDQTCAGDADMRRRVEGLLGAFERAGGFLKEAAIPLARTLPLFLPTEKPGDRIGRYKLLQPLGEGGCGVVYMAEQEEPVRRRVALKIIKLGMDTKQVIARFEAERQALALMDHPNIAKVLDAGATETGRPYFVMELVRGVKITEFCDENKISTEERLKLFMQVCQAIQHAHQKGVIHRDIKPSNILVTINEPGAPGVPKVIDFGIAKATAGRLTDQTLFTAFEQFIGTPAYMSPEQAVLTALDVDTRSDIYSLGVLLYELLTGRTPFDQKELLEAGLDEMRRTIREKEPVKPSTRLVTMVEGELTKTAQHQKTEPPKLIHVVRGDLDWIVMKCLEKDRARRYETANGLASDIARLLNNEPIVARPPSKLYRFQKSVQRNKLTFSAAAAVGLALLVGLGVSTWMFFKEKAERQRAVAAEREQVRLREEAQKARATAEADELKAQTAAVRSEQVAQFLKDMLNGVGPWVAQGRDTELLRLIVDSTVQRVESELRNQPDVEAELLDIAGRIYFETGPLEKAETNVVKAIGLTEALTGDQRDRLARMYHDLALVYWRQGRLAEAESIIGKSVAILRALPPLENHFLKNALPIQGGILMGEGRLTEAEAAAREALRLAKAGGDKGDSSPRWALVILGQVLCRQGKLGEAEATFDEANALFRADGPTNAFYYYYAESLRFLGETLVDERKLPEAEAALREALEVHRKFSDQQQSPLFAYALTTMAGILNQQGKYYEAEDALRQAWLIQQKALGEEHPDTIRTRSQLIGVLKKEGKTTLAGTTLRKPTASDQTPKDNTVFDYQNSLETLGEALHREGKLPEAEAFLREALAAYRKFPDQQRQKQLSWVLISLAAVLKEQGRAEEAEPLLRESVAIYRALGNTTAIEYEDTLRSLGETLLSRKKLPEAESFLREAIAVHRNASGRQPSPRLAWALISLADLLVQQGKDKDAEQMLLEAVTIERKALGDQHPDTTRTLDSLMNLLRQEGKTNEANALVAGQTNIVTESRSEAR